MNYISISFKGKVVIIIYLKQTIIYKDEVILKMFVSKIRKHTLILLHLLIEGIYVVFNIYYHIVWGG